MSQDLICLNFSKDLPLGEEDNRDTNMTPPLLPSTGSNKLLFLLVTFPLNVRAGRAVPLSCPWLGTQSASVFCTLPACAPPRELSQCQLVGNRGVLVPRGAVLSRHLLSGNWLMSTGYWPLPARRHSRALPPTPSWCRDLANSRSGALGLGSQLQASPRCL